LLLRPNQALNLALVLSTTLLIIGCGGTNPPASPPKRNCATADECILVRESLNAACGWSATADSPINNGGSFGGIPRDQAERQYHIFGLHPTRDIVAVIKTTVDTQAPAGSNTTYTPYLLRAMPKGPETGGPDGIDYAGPGRFLGCEWVRKVELIQKYTFKVEKACFEDDTACFAAPPYTKPETRPSVDSELAQCQKACTQSDPATCFKYPAAPGSIGSDLAKLHTSLTTTAVPFGANLAPVFSTIGAVSGKACGARTLTVARSGDATAFGPVCRQAIATPANTPTSLQSIVLDAPGVLTGTFSTAGAGSARFARLQLRETDTLSIEYYSGGSSTPFESDWIAALTFAPDHLLIAGKKRFCALIPYKKG
jgi:hypothetical protein